MRSSVSRIIFISSVFVLLLVCPGAPLKDVEAASSGEAQYAVRKVIWDYRKAMNLKSDDSLIALYTVDGKFVDGSFGTEFVGPEELRSLYEGIFETNPSLTFTVFPWNIEVTGDYAFVTCSWSLVGNYGVYNGVYWVSMSKVADEWKVTKITAYITVIHYYSPPYLFLR